jgi:4-hydroxy-3-polyprenylbenzoate decarboxylase
MILMGREIVLAITGATGAQFGVQVLRRLATNPDLSRISLIVSPMGRRCLADECGLAPKDLEAESPKVRFVNEMDLGADLSSGSHIHHGMVVLPCSAGTLGRIAAGTSDNLVARAADVCLKERRPLILCLRETPLNRIHLENMLRVESAGALVMPVIPSFYHRPKTLEDLFDSFATRVLDQLGLNESDGRRWQG